MENIEKEQKEQKVINVVNVSAPEKSANEGGSNGIAKYMSPIKDFFGFIASTNAKSIIKFWFVTLLFITMFLAFKFAYNAINDEQFMSALAKKIESEKIADEENKLSIRTDKVTPQIQNKLKTLCYSINADRAFIFELHNGKINASGLPFRYADMSYEEVNEEKNVENCAMQFQDIPLTLYKYPHYLAQNGYIYGSLREIAVVDNGFARHIERVGGKYLGMIYLTSRGLPLGFLCVSFHDVPPVTEECIKNKLEQYGKVITPLLDLDVQLKSFKANED